MGGLRTTSTLSEKVDQPLVPTFSACTVHDTQQFPFQCLVLVAGGRAALQDAEVFGAGQPFLRWRKLHAIASAVAQSAAAVSGGSSTASAAGNGSAPAGAAQTVAIAVDFLAAEDDASGDAEARPAKRARTEPSKIRCRHILMRHAAVKRPVDAVRGNKRVTRAHAEAEAEMRG